MARIFVASIVLVALMSVLVVSVGFFSHPTAVHAAAGQGADCPLMLHETALCPMTAFDHLALFRALGEAALQTTLVLVLVIGVAACIGTVRVTPLCYIRSVLSVLFRWRTAVLACFTCRQYQDLFAAGIMNPKRYA
jgi:hypothetical protein